MPARILVVDDENTITCALELLLCEHGYDVDTASTAREAEALRARRWFDLVFLDLRLPDADGIRLLEHIKQTAPETEVVLMTAHGSLEVAIDAIKRGAFYYLEKPITFELVLLLTERALQFKTMKTANPSAKEHPRRDGIFGEATSENGIAVPNLAEADLKTGGMASTLAYSPLSKALYVGNAIEYLNKDMSFGTGEEYKVRFRLTDTETKRPISALKDVGVLVFLPPGTWQQRQIAKPLDGGLYEITLNFPESGVYLLFVESPSKRVQYRQLPYLTLHANAAH